MVQHESLGMSKDIENIHKVLHMVKEIAGQSHMLGLNAAIEAARTGEAGRGFSVIAAEIRKMAEQSKTSAHEIERELNRIFSSIQQIHEIIQQVAASTQEQSANPEEINAAYNRISHTAHQLTAVSHA